MTLPDEAIAALKQGRKIDAIRAVREASATGLKEAKEIVDRYLEGNPDVREAFARHNAVSKPGISTLVILACLLIIVYFLFWGGEV